MSNSQYPLNRFNLPSKRLLVEMINKFNGVRLDASQLVFGTPELLKDDGLTSVTVKFDDKMPWDQSTRPVHYYRVEANKHPDLSHLVIHANPVLTDGELITQLLAQRGLYLEPELIEIQEIYGPLDSDQNDIGNRIVNAHLNGFDDVEAEPYVPNPDLDRNFKITFKPEHLVFFGHVYVMVRPVLALMGTTIARNMDFRQYYADGKGGRPPVDLYMPKGVLLMPEEFPSLPGKLRAETYLYERKVGAVTELNSLLATILTELTGDAWHYTPDAVLDFNIYNSTISYNGLVSSEFNTDDPRYGYVLCLELGDLCRNLSGVLRIGYRYSSSTVPTNQQYNPSSVTPIFSY
jgi:hypothetical protein